MKLNIQQQLKQQLKEVKDNTYEEIKEFGGKIVTPKDGSRIYFPSDNMVVDIKPLKFYKASTRTYNFENASKEYGASQELIKLAESSWEHVFATDLENIDIFGIGGQTYYVNSKVYVFLERRGASPNCYIETARLQDMVSPETFDTFKDLYNYKL
jgi:hypothetical protein